MKKNWIKKAIGGISLTSALFVFQACYGTPQDMTPDFFIHGQVKSKTTGVPIEGIKVSIANTIQYEITDTEGKFSLFTDKVNGVTLRFHDIDSLQNGHFMDMDTVLTDLSENNYLEITLEEK